jgi:hypothetical protein
MANYTSIQEKECLAKFSIADTNHDFSGAGIAGKISTWFKTDGKEAYKKGIPPFGGTDIFGHVLHEPGTVKYIIKNEPDEFNYNAIGSPEKTINTKTGKIYNVKTISCYVPSGNIVHTLPKTLITAETFTTELDIDNNSAFVIDATAISINAIMKTGLISDVAKKKKIYYIFSSELENDPAGKSSVHDLSIFNNDKLVDGHNYIPCISDSTDDENYTYKWDETLPENPYNMFYTSYIFQLSSLKKDYTGNTRQYKTNLTILEKDGGGIIVNMKPILNSKINNDIASLSVVMEFIYNRITELIHGAHPTPIDIFNLNAAVEQKRGGDWLQVLLCKIIALRERKLYKVDIVGKKLNITDVEIQDEIKDVYLVTHDQIALAFALFMGVNVIFTQGSSGSIHSFKINNPEQEVDYNRKKLDSMKGNDLINKKTKILEYIGSYQTLIYNVYCQKCSSEDANIINTSCKAILDMSTRPVMLANKNTIDNNIRNIFKHLYKISNSKSVFPDIESLLYKIALFDADGYTDDTIDMVIEENNETKLESTKDYINIYNSGINTFETCYNTLKTFINIDDGGTILFNYNMFLTKLIKEKYYKLIDSWTWDTTCVSTKLAPAFLLKTQDGYNNATNLFLYNLNIDESCKPILLRTFKHLYTKLDAVLTASQQEVVGNIKFTNIVQAFCIEYLIVFGTSFSDLQSEIRYKQDAAAKLIIKFFLKRVKPDLPTITDGNIIDLSAIVGHVAKNDICYSTITETNIIELNTIIIEELNPTISVLMTISENNIDDTIDNIKDYTKSIDAVNIGDNHLLELTDEMIKYKDDAAGEEEEEDAAALLAFDEKEKAALAEEEKNAVDFAVDYNADDNDDAITFANVDEPAAEEEEGGGFNIQSGGWKLGYIVTDTQKLSMKRKQLAKLEENHTNLHSNIRSSADYTAEYNFKKIKLEGDINKLKDILELTYTINDCINDVQPKKINFTNNVPLNITIGQSPKLEIHKLLTAYITYGSLKEYMETVASITIINDDIYQRIEPTIKRVLEVVNAPVEIDGGSEPNSSETTEINSSRWRPNLQLDIPFTKKNETVDNLSKSLDELYSDSDELYSDSDSDKIKEEEEEEELDEIKEEREFTNILADNSIGFYPSLPIYMIAETFLNLITNDDINESLDYELWLKYFNFLNGLYDTLKTYLTPVLLENVQAYFIGYGLKEIFFTANNYTDGNDACITALQLTGNDATILSSMSCTLSNMISGYVVQSEKEVQMGIALLQSDIFTNYITKMYETPAKTFQATPEILSISDLRKNAKEFLLKVGEEIILGRSGQIYAQIYTGTDVGTGIEQAQAQKEKDDQQQAQKEKDDQQQAQKEKDDQQQAQKEKEDYDQLQEVDTEQYPINSIYKVSNVDNYIQPPEVETIINQTTKNQSTKNQPDTNMISQPINLYNELEKGGQKTQKNKRVYRKKYTKNANKRSNYRKNKNKNKNKTRNGKNKRTRRNKNKK